MNASKILDRLPEVRERAAATVVALADELRSPTIAREIKAGGINDLDAHAARSSGERKS